MTKKKWEDGDSKWLAKIQADEEKAKQSQAVPEAQCCFGVATDNRCPEPAAFAVTFYGYTTGLSWCARHSRPEPRLYPHGLIKIDETGL